MEIRIRKDYIEKQKERAGYRNGVSFDIVFDEILEKAQNYDKMTKRDND